VDDSEESLFVIRSMLVERDMKKPGRYWIWLDIHSQIKTVARIEASLVEDPSDFGKNKRARKKKSIFMGHHGLKVGRNILPPLPLDFHKNDVERNLVVNFEVRSIHRRHVFYTMYGIVGPGVDVKRQLEE